MLKTLVSNPTGTSTFNYVVDGTTEGQSATSMTSSVVMNIMTATTINYDAGDSKITAGTNIDGAPTVNGHVVHGLIEIALTNTDATTDSKEVSLKLDGSLTSGFSIVSFNGDVAYAVGDYLNIGTIAKGTTKTIGLIVKYSGSTPGSVTTLTASGYEYDSSFPITNMPSVTITATFANLAPVITVLNSTGTDMGNDVNLKVGQEVYYYTTITNSGNAATTGNTAISQILAQINSKNVFTIESVYYGADADPQTVVTPVPTGNEIDITTTDVIAISGKYYIKAKVIVNSLS